MDELTELHLWLLEVCHDEAEWRYWRRVGFNFIADFMRLEALVEAGGWPAWYAHGS